MSDNTAPTTRELIADLIAGAPTVSVTRYTDRLIMADAIIEAFPVLGAVARPPFGMTGSEGDESE